MDEVKVSNTTELIKIEHELAERGIGSDIAQKLMDIANEARKYSYSPYSKYSVGAALLAYDGTIYTGVNVETAARTGVCAERNALFKAVSEGNTKFLALAVAGGKHEFVAKSCTPCGVCRQVLSEFVSDDFIVIVNDDEGHINMLRFGDLFPYSFGPGNLK